MKFQGSSFIPSKDIAKFSIFTRSRSKGHDKGQRSLFFYFFKRYSHKDTICEISKPYPSRFISYSHSMHGRTHGRTHRHTHTHTHTHTRTDKAITIEPRILIAGI